MYKDATEAHGAGVLADAFEKAKKRVEIAPPAAAQPKITLPPIISSKIFMQKIMERPPVLIEGLLHKGSKLNLSGGSKSFKTWVLMDMALSVAAGAPWWNIKTTAGKVLYINLEIQDAFFHDRLSAIKEAKGIGDEVWDNLDLQNLRGHCADFTDLRDAIISAAGTAYSLIIIDPLYKVMGDRDENSAGNIAGLLNEFERVAVQTGAAVVYGHHFSKGNQSQKESIDRMSGSGVFARDADSLLVITKHQNENVYAIDATLRNFKPMKPFCVKWQHPLMLRDTFLDPANLKQVKKNTRQFTTDQLMHALGAQSLTNKDWYEQVSEKVQMSERTFNNLLKELRDKKSIAQNEKTKEWIARDAD